MTDYALRLAQPINLFLLPVLSRQGARVKRDTPRLPEAETDEALTPGTGTPVRLLILGDSMAAGVGVAHNADGLAGQLAHAVARDTGRAVSWRVVARTGATARFALENLTHRAVDPLTQWRPDAVVVVVGINNLLRFRRLSEWKQDIRVLAADIWRRTGKDVPLIFSGMPPVRYFPALPQPLRGVLSVRARLMDEVLAKTTDVLGAVHVPLPTQKMDEAPKTFFAEDQFHPSARGYQELAAVFSPVIVGAGVC